MEPPDQQIASQKDSRTHLVKQKNALFPTLWLVGTVTSVCATAAYLCREDVVLKIFFISVIAVVVAVALYQLLYFTHKDPDRLQSEDFLIQQQLTRTLAAKGKKTVAIDANMINAIRTTNPEVKQLPPARDEEEEL